MNQRKAGVILNYISKAVQILTGLLYTPVMLQCLGQSEYGTYQLVYSVISYLSILSLGMTGAYNRFYYRYKTRNEEDNVAKLNGLFIVVFLFISLISVICGIFMYNNIEMVLGDKLLEEEMELAGHLMIYMIFNMALTFPASVFDCYVSANEAFIFQKVLIILQGIMGPFVTLPLLFLGYGSVGAVFVTTFLTVLKFIVNVIYSTKNLKMRFRLGRIDWKLLKEIVGFSSFIVISQIVEIINWNIDNYLLGRMVGATSVAIYGVASQINNLYMQLSTAISSIFSPQINQIVSRNDDGKELNALFIKVGRIQFTVLLFVLLEFGLIGKSFITLWVGTEYLDSFLITMVLIVPITVPLIQNVGIEIQYAKNMHRVRAFVYLIVAILNVFISIGLIGKKGALGAAIGTSIALLLGNILFMNYYYHRKIGLNIPAFWGSISRFTPSALLTCVIGVIINSKNSICTWMDLLINAILIGVVYMISVYFLSFNSYEKNLIKSVNDLFRRRHR